MISGINENYRYTQAAAQALKYAGDEAKAARCAGIGTEHLLLGLVREENGTLVLDKNNELLPEADENGRVCICCSGRPASEVFVSVLQQRTIESPL